MRPDATALVIGGTGPTGPHVVNGLIDQGFTVTILHTGRHESPDIGPEVRHIHTNPFDAAETETALDGENFDLAVVMYGRLRDLAVLLAGRVGKFVSIGGFPVYVGWGDADSLDPPGMRVPTREDGPLVSDQPPEFPVNRKVAQIAVTEQAVFSHHPTASHFRYPWIYGPNQVSPREWKVVRRVLDGRQRIVLPDSGLSLQAMAHAQNAAHMVLRSVAAGSVADGEAYNVSDEWTPTLLQWVEILADALGHRFEVVHMPWHLATVSQHLTQRSTPHHRIIGCDKAMFQLGYRDVVDVTDGLRVTARWLADNPVEPGSVEERSIGGRFDYEAEDRLIEAWLEATGPLEEVAQAADPQFVDRYAASFDEAPHGAATWKSFSQ